jgi:hypothetical protein
MRRLILSLALVAASAFAASADCQGTNILAGMPPDDRARLESLADRQPFARGILWHATRQGQRIDLVGTYHLDDPRHTEILAAVRPLVSEAETVFVEAGPEEEAALNARLAREPELMVLAGRSLPEMLAPAEWADLTRAMARRGVPGFMAARFQPWYVAVVLAIPPCAMDDLRNAKGLDGQIVDLARETGRPLRALEPYDTVFRIFGTLPLDEQIAMIRSSLALDARVEDFSTTLADTYFEGQTRLIWELMREELVAFDPRPAWEIEADLAVLEKVMMVDRNRAWVPLLEAAAAEGPVLAAFGALHLPGPEGVPALLAARGWRLEPLPHP